MNPKKGLKDLEPLDSKSGEGVDKSETTTATTPLVAGSNELAAVSASSGGVESPSIDQSATGEASGSGQAATSPTLADADVVISEVVSESEQNLGRPEEVVKIQMFIESDGAADIDVASVTSGERSDSAVGKDDVDKNLVVDVVGNVEPSKPSEILPESPQPVVPFDPTCSLICCTS